MSRKLLCAVYAAIALVALVATWSQNILHVRNGGSSLGFFETLKDNPSSRGITADIFLLGLSVTILMVIEARRVGVKFVWAYIIGAFVIAISVAFPLFPHRSRTATGEVRRDTAAAGRHDPAGTSRHRDAGHHRLGGSALARQPLSAARLARSVIEAITPPSFRMSVPVR